MEAAPTVSVREMGGNTDFFVLGVDVISGEKPELKKSSGKMPHVTAAPAKRSGKRPHEDDNEMDSRAPTQQFTFIMVAG